MLNYFDYNISMKISMWEICNMAIICEESYRKLSFFCGKLASEESSKSTSFNQFEVDFELCLMALLNPRFGHFQFLPLFTTENSGK